MTLWVWDIALERGKGHINNHKHISMQIHPNGTAEKVIFLTQSSKGLDGSIRQRVGISRNFHVLLCPLFLGSSRDLLRNFPGVLINWALRVGGSNWKRFAPNLTLAVAREGYQHCARRHGW